MKEKLGRDGLNYEDSRREIVVQENGRIYRGHNEGGKRVLVYKVDGGMIKAGKKCDYAIGLIDEKVLYFIELKGCDIREAAEQFLATLETVSDRIAGCVVNCRVVLSRVPRPDIRASSVMRLEKKLARYKGGLRKATRVMEESL